MDTERNVALYLVHVYLDGNFEWENDKELHKLIYQHGRVQTIPLGTYEPDAEMIYKKLKILNIDLESIKKVLKNPGNIVIISFDKYDNDECLKGEYTLCIGLAAYSTLYS
jgi:hypothetical protein